MKLQETNKLKEILKPIIMECIKEAIFEEGVLSTLVAEVATGLNQNTIVESSQKENFAAAMSSERSEKVTKRLKESKNKMLEAIGKDAYGGVDVFEGTAPLSSAGSPSTSTPSGPLSGVDPSDKGVNIDGLMGVFGKKWNALK